MRHNWKLGAGLFLMMAVSLALTAQTAPQPAKPAADETISATGCVEAGVEAGCLVLKDSKTGTLYNLFFTGAKPALGIAIRFTGTPKQGVTTCMQGKPVDVKKWQPVKMRCPKPTGG